MPYVQYTIEQFGVERCIWSSNFPPDGAEGITYVDNFQAYVIVFNRLGLSDVSFVVFSKICNKIFFWKSNLHYTEDTCATSKTLKKKSWKSSGLSQMSSPDYNLKIFEFVLRKFGTVKTKWKVRNNWRKTTPKAGKYVKKCEKCAENAQNAKNAFKKSAKNAQKIWKNAQNA